MIISTYIEKQFNITVKEDVAQLINNNASMIHFPAGYIPLFEGDKASKLYLILTGIVRGYYIDKDGNDITKCFSSENEFFSTEGFRTNNSSSFSIECLEDCNCIQFSYSLIQECMNKDDQIKNQVTLLFLKEVGKLEKSNQKLMLMNAEERYLDFCNEYPTLASRISKKYIASYIGIRSPSLSRIRKNLKKTNQN